MANKYDIYFNSGQLNALHYQPGDNVSFLEITNSDNEYYQSGRIQLYNAPSTQTIGDECQVWIDESMQFDGYISRKQQTIDKGVNFTTYQLVGKTYDLWRYVTDNNALYSGTTCFIASSLVATYCSGITGSGVSLSHGTNLTNEVDLTNMQVGDAIVRLSEIDGFKFFVNNNNALKYYEPSGTYNFSILESDIINMSPVEEADEDLVNDCLVLGGSDYSSKTNVSPAKKASRLFPSGILVAQSFVAEDTQLSAIQLYLDRSSDPNQPDNIAFEIWDNTANDLFEDDFDDYSYLDTDETHYNMKARNGYLQLSGNIKTWGQLASEMIDASYEYGQTFKPSVNCIIERIQFIAAIELTDEYLDYEIRNCTDNTVGSGEPGATVYRSGSTYNVIYMEYKTIDWDLDPPFYADSGTQYAIYAKTRNAGPGDAVFTKTTESIAYPQGRYWQKTQGAGWVIQPAETAYFKIYSISGGYPTSGMIDSIAYSEDCQYIKLDISGCVSSNKIYISGTNSGSSGWESLVDNTWKDFGFEWSSGSRVKYKMSGNTKYTPKIDMATFTISDDTGDLGVGGGVPKSGSKVEWSDDIDWSDGDVPYPPSYSSWKTYSDKKLTPPDFEGNTLWMVFEVETSGTKYWKYYYDSGSSYSGKIVYSWNDGVSWSTNTGAPDLVPDGNMTFKLGWKEGEISARSSNQTSIEAYGKHFKKITDSNYTTSEQAQERADQEVYGMELIPKKGTITIDGTTTIDTDYRFSSNFANFDIDEVWDIVSYTQRIDKNGFTTTINYGKQPFDISSKVSKIEHEQETG